MSEERFDRLETQIGQVLQAIIVFDVRITELESRMEERMTGLENRMTGLENRMNDRMSVLETTLSATMRGGFNSLRATVNDIDIDLAKVEQRAEDSARKVRRLNQRLIHLEGRTDENPEENPDGE
jgi:chromosome segregation ATPase